MKITSIPLAILIFVLLFGGIGVTSAFNWWKTENTKIPATFSEGAVAGQYNPADIRGSYTFGEVSELFNVPLVDLQAAFRLPAGTDPAGFAVKSLESLFTDLPVEMGTGSVRLFVAFYHGLPYDLSSGEDSYVFAEAARILTGQNRMSPEQSAYLESHIVDDLPAPVVETTPVETAAPLPASQSTPVPTEHAAPAYTITGKTTFQDVLDWGLTQESIEVLLGAAMPAPQMTLKDYVTQQGEEFMTLKAAFQAEVDKLK